MTNLQEQINQLQLRVSELELKIMLLESNISQNHNRYIVPQRYIFSTPFRPGEITC